VKPDRWREIELVFHRARELAGDQRAAFLDQTCSGDPEMLSEVASLLDCAEGAAEFVDGLGLRVPRMYEGLAGSAPHTLAAGSSFGRYKIRWFVGSGGMGEVYLAKDTQLDRNVALKLLPSWLNSEKQPVSRFRIEALAASKINHPNVPAVFDAGEIDGRYFIASEYVEGVPLTHRIKQGKIPWPEAVALTLQVAHALEAAHDAGIIHRDVKPANILLRKTDGRAKLVDFGIAKIAEDLEERTSPSTALTATGLVLGTPGYMPPEQSQGSEVDCRADIWSLAAVSQEMVTGGPRVPGSSKVETSPDLPPRLAAVLARALDPDPERRYQTVREFANDLSRVQQRAWPVRTLVAGAAVAMIGICAFLFVHSNRSAETHLTMQNPQKLTARGNVRDAIISPDSRYVIYSVGESGRECLRLLQVRTGADQERIPYADGSYIGLTFAPDGDHFYYTFDPHANTRDLYEASVIPGIEPRRIVHDIDSPVAISPNGRQIAYLRGNPSRNVHELHIADIDGSHDRILTANPNSAPFTDGGVAWSKDGKLVFAGEASGQGVALISIDVSSGQRQVLSRPIWSLIRRISLLKDGDTLIFAGTTVVCPIFSLFEYSISRREWKQITPEGENYPTGYTGGSDIVAVRQDRLSSVWTASVDAPEVVRSITPPAGHYDQIAWSPSGRLITSAVEGGHENLWIFGPAGAKEQLTYGSFGFRYLTSSPDGHTVAFTTNRTGNWNIWTLDIGTHETHRITNGQLEDQSPTFATDGWILYGHQVNGAYQIWRVSSAGAGASRLIDGSARSPTVSASGRYMVCRLLNGQAWQVAVVDLQTLKVVANYPKAPFDSRIRWSPDEKALTYAKEESGVSNIWKMTIGTGIEEPITRFKDQKIFSFDWSRDGRNLAMVRGIDASEVVLFKYPE